MQMQWCYLGSVNDQLTFVQQYFLLPSFQYSSDANYFCKHSFFHKTKQETVDLVKIHMEESQNNPGNEDIYEDMLTASQNFITNFDSEDIYESMMKLNPEMG